jgi:nodulation protein F
MDALANDIVEKIKALADPSAGEISLSTELNSLGIHSLELTEIIFDIEDTYGIEVELNTVDAWDKLKTIGDIVDEVRAIIARKA